MTTPQPMPAAEARALLLALKLTQQDFAELTAMPPRTLRWQLQRGWIDPLAADKLRDLQARRSRAGIQRPSKEMPTASWVVVSLATGKPVLETWNPKVAASINLESYRVVPIGAWLGSINGKGQGS